MSREPCRICGCTETSPCGGGATDPRVEPDLCEVCEQLILELAPIFSEYLDVAGLPRKRSGRADVMAKLPVAVAATILASALQPAVVSAMLLMIRDRVASGELGLQGDIAPAL